MLLACAQVQSQHMTATYLTHAGIMFKIRRGPMLARELSQRLSQGANLLTLDHKRVIDSARQ